MATLVRKSFTDKQIKQIARKYIFGKGMTGVILRFHI